MNADYETRIATLEVARRQLEDAFLVMTHLETKQNNVIRQMAEEQMESDRRHRERTAEFDDKLNALIDIIGRQQGGIETRPKG